MNRRRFTHTLWGYAFLAPYLVLFAAFVILPLVFGLVLSFMRWNLLTAGPPELVGAAQYREAIADPYFWRALKATGLFVLLAVPATVLLALAIALGLAAVQRRKGLYRAAYFLPVMINISVAGILWRWFYNSEFGLFNGYLAPLGLRIEWLTDASWAMISIVLMTLWWTAGSPAVILLAGLEQIPGHYHEAARVDGAGAWQRFRFVTLPLLRPVLAFVAVINVIGAFQVFGQAFLITRGGPEMATRVLVQYIYESAFQHFRMGYGAAMSWLLFVVIAVFSFVQYRLLKER